MYKLQVGISKEASASSIKMGDKLEFMGTDAARFVDAMVGACGAFLINSVFLIKLGSNQLTVRARVGKRNLKRLSSGRVKSIN